MGKPRHPLEFRISVVKYYLSGQGGTTRTAAHLGIHKSTVIKLEVVMALRGGRHWWTFEITANVVDVLPRMFSLFRKVDFPAALELDLKEPAPLTKSRICV